MKNQRGSVTVFAILTMIFLSILISGLLPMVMNELKINTINKDMIEAQYAAETGAKRVIVGFNQSTPNLSWIDDGDVPFIDDVNKKKYNVIIYLATDVSQTPLVSSAIISGKTYIIRSKGTVGKTTKTVSVSIGVASSSNINGSVFSKYTTYSKGTLQVDNSPKLTGDIGSGSSIIVNSSNPLIYGTAYTPNVPVFDQWSWNKNAVTGGYLKPTSTDALDITIPPIPTMLASGVALTNNSISNGSGSYYSSGSYTLNSTNITASTGQPLVIYINGNLQLTGTSKISGDNITIYATGNIILDNTSSIQQSSSGGSLKLYSKGTMQLTNSAAINSDNTMIEAGQSINFNSSSSINKNSSTAITKVYSSGDIQFTNSFTMGGSAGLVETSSAINLNSNQNSLNTVFIAGSGSSQITNSVQLAGFYTNGNLSINSSPTITYNDKKSQILNALNLGGGGAPTGETSPITISNWMSI